MGGARRDPTTASSLRGRQHAATACRSKHSALRCRRPAAGPLEIPQPDAEAKWPDVVRRRKAAVGTPAMSAVEALAIRAAVRTASAAGAGKRPLRKAAVRAVPIRLAAARRQIRKAEAVGAGLVIRPVAPILTPAPASRSGAAPVVRNQHAATPIPSVVAARRAVPKAGAVGAGLAIRLVTATAKPVRTIRSAAVPAVPSPPEATPTTAAGAG